MVQAIYELPCNELLSSMWSEFTQAPASSTIDVAKWLVDMDQPKVKPISQVVSCLTPNVNIRAGLITVASLALLFSVKKYVLPRLCPQNQEFIQVIHTRAITVPGFGYVQVSNPENHDWHAAWTAFVDYKNAFENENIIYPRTEDARNRLKPFAVDYATKCSSYRNSIQNIEEKMARIIEENNLPTLDQINAYIDSHRETSSDQVFSFAKGDVPTVEDVFRFYETILLKLHEDEQG